MIYLPEEDRHFELDFGVNCPGELPAEEDDLGDDETYTDPVPDGFEE